MGENLGMNFEELITIYPQNLRSYIRDMYNHIRHQGSRVASIKLEENQKRTEMDQLLNRLLWGQLQCAELFTQKDQKIADMKAQSGLTGLYDRWLEESINILMRSNYLVCNGELYSVHDVAPVNRDALWKEWEEKKKEWMKDPNMKSRVVLVESTLRALPEILTGEVPATDIMFPNSSMELVEGVYKNNTVADYMNEVLADAVVAYIQQRLAQGTDTKLRILEIGAGTGGTSAMLFEKLKPFEELIQEYCYTDISKAFLIHAEKEYGHKTPYLTYKIFNVEAPAAGQGIGAGEYDIVIAANVLHATKDIRQTLRNTKVALKSNGLLMLNEISGNSLFTHLTFGLLEGWWLYRDPELRIPGCPGLSSEAWQGVLESEGFNTVMFVDEEAHTLGQQIIIAESDGIVRQKQEIKRNLFLTEKVGRRELDGPETPNAASQHFKVKIAESSIVMPLMVEEHVRDTIMEKLSESLKVAIDNIDIDESFADYGVDSITGVHLIQAVNKALAVELETTDIFDYSSVNQLAKYILSKYKDTIAATLKNSVE
ncbi:MAG TPA: methyltransferase, partial [Clostridia bacterium]|nr:methyltransferase [Clostridia bacterium]